MDHEVRYTELAGYGTVMAVCSCRLTAVSANRSGVDRLMRRKHRDADKQRRYRARLKAESG